MRNYNKVTITFFTVLLSGLMACSDGQEGVQNKNAAVSASDKAQAAVTTNTVVNKKTNAGTDKKTVTGNKRSTTQQASVKPRSKLKKITTYTRSGPPGKGKRRRIIANSN